MPTIAQLEGNPHGPMPALPDEPMSVQEIVHRVSMDTDEGENTNAQEQV